VTYREWLVLRAWHAWSTGEEHLLKRLHDDMLLAGLDPDDELRHYNIYNED
jgi:hypothetical protein